MTQTVLLGDVATIQTGPFGSQLHQKDYVTDGTPIVTVEHLGQDRITTQNLPRVSDNDKKRLSRYWLQEGDTVFSRVGSVDRASYVHKEEDGWLFSGRCLRVHPDNIKVNPRFLSFQLRSPAFTNFIKSIAVGATMPSINTKLLATAPIQLLERNRQDQVAELLDSIETKIEVNRRMNETLEKIGQALFRHYFIDNPEAKTWPQGKFSDLTEVTTGKGSTKSLLAEGGKYPLYGAGGLMGTSDKFLIDEPVIITGRVGTLGRIQAVTGTAWFSDNVLIMKPKSGYFGFVYCVVKTIDFISMNRGSSQPLITQTDLKNRSVRMPDKDKVVEFNEQFQPIFNLTQNNEHETLELIKLRELLLPRLISGKIKV